MPNTVQLLQDGQPVYPLTDASVVTNLPTVPTISTDISADATSDTKTASPKAVKTYADTKYVKPSGGIPASDIASGVIPDAVEANPTVPSGTTPASLSGLKIGSSYYDIEAGGGTVTDVTVGGTSVVSGGVASVPAIPTALASLSDDSTHRVVSDTEKSAWNGKQAALVSGTNIKTINGGSILGSGDLQVASTDATVVQNKGTSTANVMSQDAVTRALDDNRNYIIKISPNSIFDRGNKNGLIYTERKFSFGDIQNLTVVYRDVVYDNQINVNHYGMGIVLGFFQSSDTYLALKIDGYNVKVIQYSGGSKLHEETVCAINSGTNINTYGDFAVMFNKANSIFRIFGYDTSNSTVVQKSQFSISGWDLSSLTDVYLCTSLSEYGSCLCCSNVLVNSPSMLSSYIAAPLNVGYYNTPQGTEYNKNIYLAGTGVTVGGTIVQTISDTDKIVSVSNSSASYFALGPSNLDDSYGWYHVRLDFTSVGTGAYLSAGVMYKYIYIESDGLLDTSIISGNEKFYPVVGKTYDLYYCFGPNQTQSYQRSYGLREYGDMTFEVSEPYMFNTQVQNICSETYNGYAFSGAIPFVGSPSFIEFFVSNVSALSNLRIPIYSIKAVSGAMYMWNGSVWKQINNS